MTVIQTESSDLYKSLKLMDFSVFQAMQRADAPPFFGLLNVSDKTRDTAGATIKAAIVGNQAQAVRLLRRYRHLAAWYLCDVVRSNYGKDGAHHVWPDIADSLGLKGQLSQPIRNDIHEIVASLCRRLGLPVPPERLILLFQLHAGVSSAQLEALIDAFLSQEDVSGFPPEEDGYRLNIWEDQALEFLHPTLTVLRAPILWDATAWHAALYARCRRDDFSSSDLFATDFNEKLKTRQGKRGRSRSSNLAPPRPRLMLDGMDLYLRLPDGAGRVKVSCDDQSTLRLRCGQLWPLPTPLPKQINWAFNDHSGVIEILNTPGSILAADLEEGSTPQIITQDATISAQRIALFSRAPMERMTADGKETISEQVGEELFVAISGLTPSGTVFCVGTHKHRISQRLHRRLSIDGGIIAKGPAGNLHDRNATLTVSTGMAEAADRAVSIETSYGDNFLVPFHTNEFGQADISIDDLLLQANEPIPRAAFAIKFQLMRPSVNETDQPIPSGLWRKAWLWPDFQGRCGNALKSSVKPDNIALQDCRGIEVDDSNLLCIAKDHEHSRAELAFKIEGQVRKFILPAGDLSVVHVRADGTQSPLPRDSHIVLTHAARNGAIRIGSTDINASVNVCGEVRKKPFAFGSTCTIPLRGVSSGWVRLLRDDGRHVDLVEITDACAFSSLGIRHEFGKWSVWISVPNEIDAVRIDLSSETGDEQSGTCYLGADRFIHLPSQWVEMESTSTGAIHLICDASKVPRGLWLGQISVRDEQGWHPLTSPRGDTVSMLLDAGDNYPDELQTSARLNQILKWLEICHAEQSWFDGKVGGTLTRRLSSLSEILDESPGGRARVLAQSHSDDWREGDTGWMPPLILLQARPKLFESPAMSFHMAPAGLNILADLSGAPVQELKALDSRAFVAFGNVHQAMRTGEPLRDFDRKRFFSLLRDPSIDHDPFSGRRWKGTPLLGPGHWRASHEELSARIAEASFFSENPDGMNGLRSQAILRIANPAATAPFGDIPVPASLDETERELHQRITSLLSSFATASRRQKTENWTERVSRSSGMEADEVIRAMGDVLRLAPELFTLHMIVAELEDHD